MDPALWAAQLDARALAVLLSTPTEEPLEEVAQRAGLDILGLRASMRRLAPRQPGRNWPWAAVSEWDQGPMTWPAERRERVV